MDNSQLTFIEVCAGVGMLGEGFTAATNGRCVAYVERESYCAATLLARMESKAVEPAPIWCGNLEGIEWNRLRGTVDAIIGGFPCQPWSAAGKREGTTDERWIWPAIVDAVRGVEPGIVFLENVDGLVSGGGLAVVLGDLAALGFHAEWGVLAAGSVGASHERKRIFILAVHPERGFRILRESSRGAGFIDWNSGELEYPASTERTWAPPITRKDDPTPRNNGKRLADASGGQFQDAGRGSDQRSGVGCGSAKMEHSGHRPGCAEQKQQSENGSARARESSAVVDNPAGARCDGTRPGPATETGSGECVPGPGFAGVGYATDGQQGRQPDTGGKSRERRRDFDAAGTDVAHADRGQREQSGRAITAERNGQRGLFGFDGGSKRLANTEQQRHEGFGSNTRESAESEPWNDSHIIFAPGPGRWETVRCVDGRSIRIPLDADAEKWCAILAKQPFLSPAIAAGSVRVWWDNAARSFITDTAEPGVCGMVDGLAVVVDESRADQLRAIGNGVVPLQAALAFALLAARFFENE